MSQAADNQGIFDAQSDQHAVAMAVRVGREILYFADDSAREAKLLLSEATGKKLHEMTCADFTPTVVDAYIALCERRAGREPMSHILGYRDFWKHRFAVTPDVLDPRGDTETLIEAALAEPFERVLDLGTGSGCILLSLLGERPEARGLGADLSEAALAVARQNAQSLGIAAEFIASDWFAEVEGMFDLIVSNPPYISTTEMETLAPELSFEPRMALTDEGDGLGAYRVICAGAGANLRPNGRLMLEIGWAQGAVVSQMMTDAGFADVGTLQDLDGRDRVVCGRKPA